VDGRPPAFAGASFTTDHDGRESEACRPQPDSRGLVPTSPGHDGGGGASLFSGMTTGGSVGSIQLGRIPLYIRFQSPDVSKASEACSTIASSNLRPTSISPTNGNGR
jgi:hypothetical protein